MSGQRRLHVVGVVLDDAVLQDRLQASALFLLTLLGARDLGRQAAFWGAALVLREAGCSLR